MAEHEPRPDVSGENPTALVLGVGGNVSQGIQKALSMGTLRPRVVAACVSSRSAGLYVADRSYVSPYADDPDFFEWLVEVCEREAVDVVLSGVEPVLSVLAERVAELWDRAGAVALVSDPDTLDIGGDKLRTARWLADNGLNSARTADAADPEAVTALAAETGLPLIAKPRSGRGAHGVMVLAAEPDLDWARGRDGYMVQELLGNPDSEYTVGCFSDREGRVRGTIAMRRRLEEGTTVTAEAGAFPEVTAEASRIATALRPAGPCNVQLRIHDGRPVCFEINVRFSGTTPIRARLGFNEVEEGIRHYALGVEARDLPTVDNGVVVRYWNELHVDERAMHALEAGRLDDPHAYPPLVEDFEPPR